MPMQMPNAKTKEKLKVNKEKRRKKKLRDKGRKNDNNNNNYVKFDGSITDSIMKGVTISPGSSATMISDFRNIKKSAAAYAASKGYKHWPVVIKIMEPVVDKV